MIQKLQGLLTSGSSNPLIDYMSLLNISDRTRLESISSLAQQYQRFSTAAPIASVPLGLPVSAPITSAPSIVPVSPSLAAAPDFCPGALALQHGTIPSSLDWKCPSCHLRMAAWLPKGLPPPSWATGCKGMSFVFSFSQHVSSTVQERQGHGKHTVYRQCIVCWDKLGIVSKKMTKEDWLVHINEHLTTGGFRLCRDEVGTRLKKSTCGDQSCQKIHSRDA